MKDKWLHSDLFSAFETFGNIVSAKVSIDKNHASKGFGYVQFENANDAEKAKTQVLIITST
jgi:RNA recognition motif-containing protein